MPNSRASAANTAHCSGVWLAVTTSMSWEELFSKVKSAEPVSARAYWRNLTDSVATGSPSMAKKGLAYST